VDVLGHSLAPEVTQLREEVAYVRLMMEQLLTEVKQLSTSNKPGKKAS